MKIKKLELKNIRSYDEETIEFPEGSTLLTGDIGSGKTTVLLAIEYSLFGLQPGQKGSSLLASGKNAGKVVLELEISGNDVIIERNLTKGPKSITQDYAAITINGKKEELSVTELKTKILRLLKYPDEFLKKTNLLYRYTLYSPQEEMKQIILENADERLNILRHIFGIDKYKKIYENLLIVASKLREESKILQLQLGDISELRKKSQSISDSLEAIDEKIASQNQALSSNMTKRKSIEYEIKEVQGKIEEKKRFEKEIEKISIVLKNKLQQKAELEKSSNLLKSKISETKELFDQPRLDAILLSIAENNKKADSINREHISLSGMASSLKIRKQELLDNTKRIFQIEICPICLQNVPERHKHNILSQTESTLAKTESELKKIMLEAENLKNQLGGLKSELANLEQKKSELAILKVKTEEIFRARESISEMQKTGQSIDKDIELLDKHTESLKKLILDLSKFDVIYKIREKELKDAFLEEKKSEIELAELRKEKEMIKKYVLELEDEIERKSGIQKKASSIDETEGWISGDFQSLVLFTEKSILAKLRGEFSRLFNKWFSMLTNESFYVHLDENFTPIILQGEYELDYSFLSGGERTAVALAYRLALNQLINSVFSNIRTRDIIILDEPTDGFSEQQLDKVRDILKELNVRQLILVSHEQKIESFVDNIIRLKKEKGSHSVRE